ncbi:glycosyltransferase family 2 protein [Palleronia sp. LCG004]|uniref:glycosyltransferase family 2 protein n=1 Tax=Palleronia sp. LCG004 TaxID=3079304 RepID=UPI002941C81A|nr:glycosyltransferase [Palleronia sp. LCG004]WOI56631.1 glycosyltransferase [Palleronia sp. LCG004]
MDDLTASVVIPSFNRPDRLRACLEALMDDPDDSFDVIVVDDGSPEPLGPVCAPFGPRVTCLRQDNRGPAAARNRGVAESGGRLVLFTDDDCRPARGWVDAMRRAQDGEAGRLVGGRVVNLLEDDTYAAASQSLCDFLYEYFDAASGEMPFFTSNNIACDRAHFLAMGGFDESFPLAAAEDRDFGLRWRAAGGTLVFAEDAVVGHAHAMTLRSFLRQHSNYGRGARHLHTVMDDRGDARPKFERLKFYGDLVRYPLGREGRARVAQSALLFLSQAAMVSGYARQARAQRAGPDRSKRRT